MNLDEKLVSLRKEKGLSQMQVAEALEVSRQAISRWEVGTALPSTENLKRLAELYGVPVDTLLNEGVELPLERPQPVETSELPPREERVPEVKSPWKNRILGGAIALLVIGGVWVGYAAGYRQGTEDANVNETIPLSQLEQKQWDPEGAVEFELHGLGTTEGG